MAAARPPATPDEARARYYARYGWALVIALLGDRAPSVPPVTVDQWYTLAHATRSTLQADPAERLADQLEQAARALRAQLRGELHGDAHRVGDERGVPTAGGGDR